jgi:hypothetical protein
MFFFLQFLLRLLFVYEGNIIAALAFGALQSNYIGQRSQLQTRKFKGGTMPAPV